MESNCRKLFILFLKFITILISLGYTISSIFLLFGIISNVGWIYGVSLCTTVFMIIASYTFKFCTYHRLFLYHSFISEIIKQVIYKFPTTNIIGLLLTIVFFFIISCIALYQHLKQGAHNKQLSYNGSENNKLTVGLDDSLFVTKEQK